jgi:major membrane immunogen (membrane-anchored lipoprotein)
MGHVKLDYKNYSIYGNKTMFLEAFSFKYQNNDKNNFTSYMSIEVNNGKYTNHRCNHRNKPFGFYFLFSLRDSDDFL